MINRKYTKYIFICVAVTNFIAMVIDKNHPYWLSASIFLVLAVLHFFDVKY
ncbi:hypothetical protein [Epilithonimonas sp.]|uniref:hypothetical protein n=1 Tax=Epilithonimonas sp. TaxID=2894511 RepID=UPI0035B4A125